MDIIICNPEKQILSKVQQREEIYSLPMSGQGRPFGFDVVEVHSTLDRTGYISSQANLQVYITMNVLP